MITIPLSTEDLTKVRLAPSPLWETITSFGVLLHHGRDSVHASWATRTRRTLPGTDLSALVAAMCVKGRCPDFLTPERERLLEAYLSDPECTLKRLVVALRRYHDLALAPYWPQIQELLEGDVIRRGQALALGGIEALFSGLHPKARYEGGVLELDKSYETVVEPAGRGITLVPCVFAWPRVEVLIQSSYRPTVAYGPRGVANLWTSSSAPPNRTALEAALSTGRASVLKGLIVPRTTTELARQLGLAPGAVSAHLSRLKAAGLVEPHRSGRRVYYRLSLAGESLLEIFEETD